MEPNINPVEVHPQLSHNGHPVDGAVVGAGFRVPSSLGAGGGGAGCGGDKPI